MDYIKISLDKKIIDILKQIKNFIEKGGKTVVFYVEKNSTNLDKNLIINLIYVIEKKNKFSINYYFYNVPFCIFREFGEQYIDNHCIFNRLCNFYEGYTNLGKCTKCKYGLFCNNFHFGIAREITDKLEGFYKNTIKKDYLFGKIIKMNEFFRKLGYDDGSVIYSSRQKFIYEFIFSDVNISEYFIDYLTLDINLTNHLNNIKYFENTRSSTFVFKDKELDKEFFEIAKNIGINFNIRGKKYLKYKSFIDKYNGVDFYFLEKISEYIRHVPKFFDFNIESEKNKYTKIFKGISKFDNIKKIKSNDTIVVKNAHEFLSKKGKIYIGKDIFSGININNFDAILLTSNASGVHNRIENVDLSNNNIGIITNIKPDITQYLNDGDELIIDFYNGTITKC